MKITDPSLPSAFFGPLRFDELEASADSDAGFALSTGSARVARLVPRTAQDGVMVLDERGECVISREGSWSLDFFWGQGSVVRTHVLWCARPDAASPRLTHELAAWATLMVLWGTLPRVPQQG